MGVLSPARGTAGAVIHGILDAERWSSACVESVPGPVVVLAGLQPLELGEREQDGDRSAGPLYGDGLGTESMQVTASRSSSSGALITTRAEKDSQFRVDRC
jgi:hypothetical protein